jgi:hypothetical protein
MRLREGIIFKEANMVVDCIFSGENAEEEAKIYAKNGGRVKKLDTLDMETIERLGLDMKNQKDGIIYTYAVIK